MVGCVIVCDNEIVGEGYHEQFGSGHAEPNAIKQVSDAILKKSTLYVTLEPCSHFGKTPPCADLIISKGIKKVVIGNLDSNPLVAGKGIQKLKDAGIEVEFGILDKECRELNKRFFTVHEKKRPYIILKWAQTQDGFISHWPLPENKKDNWITGDESKTLVHKWRAQEQAILVGYNTAIIDNPLLTTRLAEGKNPVRLIIDENLDLPVSLNVFNDDAKTIVFNGMKDIEKENLRYVRIDFKNTILEILEECFVLNISSIIVEGGTKTITEFITKGLWDEARIFVNPNKKFGQGIVAPNLSFDQTTPTQISGDLLYTLYNR